MMQIKKEDYKRSLWKNGLGHTDEIAIYPPEASLVKGDFLWRLSSARIEKSSAFSLFPAHDRVLLVLKGDGIRMIHTFEEGEAPEVVEVPTLEPYEFPGDVPSRCEPVGKGITDFSIFTRTGEVGLQHLIQAIEPDEEFVWEAQGRWNFAFVIRGVVKAASETVSEGSTFSTSSAQVTISAQASALVYLIIFE